MRIYAGDKNDDTWQHLQIKCNGIEIPFCLWFDTDEAITECLFGQYINSGEGKRTSILWTPEQGIFTYTLHNYEVWDMRTNQCVAKV